MMRVARRSSQGSLRPHVSHGATSPEHDRQAATAGRDCRDERASSPNAALRVRKAVERAPDCRRQLREVAGEHEPGWPAGVSGRSRVNTGGGESSRCRDSGVRRSCHNWPLSDAREVARPPRHPWVLDARVNSAAGGGGHGVCIPRNNASERGRREGLRTQPLAPE